MPLHAHLPLRTRHNVCVPIHLKGGLVKARLFACLPTRISRHRTDEINSILGHAPEQERGIGIASINQMGLRQQLFLGQCLMNSGHHLIVWGRGDGDAGFQIGDRGRTEHLLSSGIDAILLGRDFVGFAVYGNLTKHDAVLTGPEYPLGA